MAADCLPPFAPAGPACERRDTGAQTPAPFPWDEAMRLVVGVRGMAPRDFWAMTPIELSAILRAYAPASGGHAPGRAALDALMARFPDT